MYYTVIKHDGHLRTRGKYGKHEPQASVFYISRVFSNAQSVFSHCNTRLRLLYLLYDLEVMWRKTIKYAFSVLYSDKTWVVDQSERAQAPIYKVKEYIVKTHDQAHQYCTWWGIKGVKKVKWRRKNFLFSSDRRNAVSRIQPHLLVWTTENFL